METKRILRGRWGRTWKVRWRFVALWKSILTEVYARSRSRRCEMLAAVLTAILPRATENSYGHKNTIKKRFTFLPSSSKRAGCSAGEAWGA